MGFHRFLLKTISPSSQFLWNKDKLLWKLSYVFLTQNWQLGKFHYFVLSLQHRFDKDCLAQLGVRIYFRGILWHKTGLRDTHCFSLIYLTPEDVGYVNIFQTHINDEYLEYFLWNDPYVNATRSHRLLVIIGSGNGLVPASDKPVPAPMLTQTLSPYGVTKPQWVDKISHSNINVSSNQWDDEYLRE